MNDRVQVIGVFTISVVNEILRIQNSSPSFFSKKKEAEDARGGSDVKT